MGKPAFKLSAQYLQDFFNYHFATFIAEDPIGGKSKALIMICISIVIMVFLKNLFRYLASYAIAELRNGVLRDLRKAIYYKLLSLPKAYFTDERKGDIMSKMSADVKEIEFTTLKSIEMLFRDPASIIVFLGAMLLMSAKLTIFVFVLLPISSFIIARIGKSLKKASAKGQQKVGFILSMVEETLSGLSIIKAFNAEKPMTAKFNTENDDYKNLMNKVYRRTDLASPLSELMGVSILVVVIWFGGNLVLNQDEQLSASVFIAFIAIFSQLIPPAKSFTTAYYNIQKGIASAERIEEILNAENNIIDHPDAVKKSEFKSDIVFENVAFSYGDKNVLQNINLHIKKGETIAFVGSSGSGKTSLVNLLPRFYDVNSGSIKIDGVDIRKIKMNSLRSLIGLVSQNSILFNDSVANNIAFGEQDFNLDKVLHAAKVANAHDFINETDSGYESSIGDEGGKLSGGQRQRLSIARAVYKNPDILILDEATSALDTESEKLVQDALYNLMKNRTSLVIAHRLSTIKNADRIVVLSEGKIVEVGTHDELLDLKGVYCRLYEIQTFA